MSLWFVDNVNNDPAVASSLDIRGMAVTQII